MRSVRSQETRRQPWRPSRETASVSAIASALERDLLSRYTAGCRHCLTIPLAVGTCLVNRYLSAPRSLFSVRGWIRLVQLVSLPS